MKFSVISYTLCIGGYRMIYFCHINMYYMVLHTHSSYDFTLSLDL